MFRPPPTDSVAVTVAVEVAGTAGAGGGEKRKGEVPAIGGVLRADGALLLGACIPGPPLRGRLFREVEDVE